ncbi:hypothetical protein ACTVZO_00300 [Streptomyces sp. IBSNAI002]|uniref:hypothetical protein n=1 Tax=Streptomyces sp. IBSNAI002 TaxID=3457500 RepID=UPI003FCF52CE
MDDVEHVIVDEYVVMAQCFPASDRGLGAFRSLWLESVADELAPVIADHGSPRPLPPPFDRLFSSFGFDAADARMSVMEKVPGRSVAPAMCEAARDQALRDFVKRIGDL